MAICEIRLDRISREGESFTVDDQSVWEAPIAECGMDCRIVEPLHAQVTLIPQETGCLVRGNLQGKVAVPCNRCMEDALIDINSTFDSFENYPASETEQDEGDILGDETDELIIKKTPEGTTVFSLAGLVWEEFVLALPYKPLCRPDCKGLCPQCGTNLNNGPCACSSEHMDPRMAALRGLKVNR